MSALVRECVQFVVEREAARVGSVPNARRALSRRYKIAPGTWERAQNGTHKRIDALLLTALIEELQQEWIRIEHKLHMLKQIGAPIEDLIAAQTMLRNARTLLRMDG